MAEGDAITGAWQIELRGVVMDALACNGLTVVEWLDGFGVPSGRVLTVQKPMQHGLFPGPQFMDGRPVRVGVAAIGDTFDDVLNAKINLGEAFAPVEAGNTRNYTIPMVFTLNDATQKYRIYGMPTKAEWGYRFELMNRKGAKQFSETALCEFLATDPRVYDNATQSAIATLGTSSGGLGFPMGFPHGFGTATSGAAICVNNGNFVTYPTITITAGVSGASGITLLQDTTGEQWSITLTLSAGDQLIIDMNARTALLNGTASRNPYINRPPSTWFGLQSGTNSITLQATGVGTTATVEWRSAWLI